MIAEYHGRRFDAGIADGTSSTPLHNKAGILQRFYSPHLGEYAAGLLSSAKVLGSEPSLFDDAGPKRLAQE